MSHADQKALGMSGGPSSNKIDAERLFIIGLDGEGSTEAERIKWVKGLFPKLAAKIDANKDPRANAPLTADDVRKFRPVHAKPIVYESMGVRFPEDCGKWSGLHLLVVNTGRQTTKTYRAMNAKRLAEGSPALEAVVIGKRFDSDLSRIESLVIENQRIVATSTMQRAWSAQRLLDGGTTPDDAMALLGLKTTQGMKNLLGLLSCSERVQAAVDAGPDADGITASSALEIASKHGEDHEAQDAELTRRLDAAQGKSGREKTRALRGENDTPTTPKPVSPKKLAAVLAELMVVTGADDWRAIVGWALGAASSTLPADFRAAVLRAENTPKVKKPKTADAAAPIVEVEIELDDEQEAA